MTTLSEDLASVRELAEKAKESAPIESPYLGIRPEPVFSQELPVSAQYLIAAVNLVNTHAAEIAGLGAENAELKRLHLLMDSEETAVWNYLQKVSPWSESNDMLWSDEIITGIDGLIQRAEAAESELAACRRDAERLDWLSVQGYSYGFEDMIEGTHWEIRGPYCDLRKAIDAAIDAQGRGEG